MAVKNSIKVGPLIFLLWMFVITENLWDALYLLKVIYFHYSLYDDVDSEHCVTLS